MAEEKKKLSAKEVVADIRSGATDEFLMNKYGISSSALQALLNRLVSAGLLQQADLDARNQQKSVSGSGSSLDDKLAKLEEAFKCGLLSEAEFAKKKAALMGDSMSPARGTSPLRRDRLPVGGGEKEETAGKGAWYETPIAVIVLLVCFFPVGLYFLWKSPHFTPKTKKILTAVVVGLVILSIVVPKDKASNSKPAQVVQAPKTPEPVPDQSKPEPSRPVVQTAPQTSAQDSKLCTVVGQQGGFTNEEAFYTYMSAFIAFAVETDPRTKAVRMEDVKKVVAACQKAGTAVVVEDGAKVVLVETKDFVIGDEREPDGMAKVKKAGEKRTFWMVSRALECN